MLFLVDFGFRDCKNKHYFLHHTGLCAAVCRYCFSAICGWAGNIWLGCKESQRQAEHLPHSVLFTGLWQCWHVWLRLVELLVLKRPGFYWTWTWHPGVCWMFTMSLSTLFTVTVLHFLEPLYICIHLFASLGWRNDEKWWIQVPDFQRDTSTVIMEWSHLNYQGFVNHPEFVLISQPAEWNS